MENAHLRMGVLECDRHIEKIAMRIKVRVSQYVREKGDAHLISIVGTWLAKWRRRVPPIARPFLRLPNGPFARPPSLHAPQDSQCAFSRSVRQGWL
jgi:hypothetical protein